MAPQPCGGKREGDGGVGGETEAGPEPPLTLCHPSYRHHLTPLSSSAGLVIRSIGILHLAVTRFPPLSTGLWLP